MKKTIHKRKLQLSKTTLRQLSGAELRRATGAFEIGTSACLTRTCWSICHHSVCDSCSDSDCCLEVP